MKKLYHLVIVACWSFIPLLAVVILLPGCTATYVATNRPVDNTPPEWAPAYEDEAEVRYYYMPDIEAYYDVWNHQYIYYDRGNWAYTSYLPPAYSSYDVNTSYVVVLDRSVREPWHQHSQYTNHYPRYYYKTAAYSREGERPSRGYNENRKSAVYSYPAGERRPVTRSQPANRTDASPSRNTNQRSSPSSNSSREQTNRSSSRDQNSNNSGRTTNESRSSRTSNTSTPTSQPNRGGNAQPSQSQPAQSQSRSTESRSNAQPAQSQSRPAESRSNAQPVQSQRSAPATQPAQQNTSRSNSQPAARTSTNSRSSAPATREVRSSREERKPAASERK